MRNIETRLEEWRRAERSRDMLPAASREWQAADEEVRRARAAYHATGAQAAAYHAERAFAAEPSWWARLEAASAWWSRGPERRLPAASRSKNGNLGCAPDGTDAMPAGTS